MSLQQRRWTLLAFVILFTNLIVLRGSAFPEPQIGTEPFSASSRDLLDAARQFNPQGTHKTTILLQEWHYRFDDQGRAHVMERVIYKIVSMADAEAWAEVEADWSPWRQNRPSIRARVVAPDGTAHDLDPSHIAEVSFSDRDKRLYSDRKRLRAPLPAIREGAVVETVRQIEDTEPLLGAGQVIQLYLVAAAPIQKIRLIVDVPKSLPIRHVIRLMPGLQPQRTETDGRIRLSMEAGPLEAAKFPPLGLPSDRPRWPYVAFSIAEAWATVAQRYGEVVDSQILGEEIHALMPALDTKGSREQTISKLVAFLHEKVRYTGVEFGEASYVPRNPSETLRRGFGDCKDKSTALIAMLRAAKIEARLALLRSGPGEDVENDLPGLGQFDHAIVYIPGGRPIWIDATDEWARPGQLGEGVENRLALVTGTGTAGLLRTPASQSRDNSIVETREFFLPAFGKARVVESVENTGLPELSFREFFGSSQEAATRKFFEEYGQSTYLAKKLGKLELSDARDFSRKFHVRSEFDDAGRAIVEQASAVVAIRRDDLFERLPLWLRIEPAEKSEPRSEDVELTMPFVTEWRYRIVPSVGFHSRELPPPQTQLVGHASYSHKFEVEADGVVTGTLRFDSGSRRMTSEEAAALRNEVVRITKEQPLLIYFDHIGEEHLAESRIREALQQFRNLSKAEPKEAVHRTRTARSLLAAGLGEPARKEALAAIVLAPNLALTHQTLGWVLQHDLVGRRFEKGFDLQAALAAYRKAKELDSEDPVIRGDLAILLEHNSSGVRYGRGANLEQAIEEYRSLLKLPGTEVFLRNLLLVATAGHRVEVLKEHLPEDLPTDEASSAIHIAARALVYGPDNSLQQANRAIPDNQKRMVALTEAARVLIQFRHYPVAGSILAAAAKAGANSAQLLAQAQQMTRTKRYEAVQVRMDTPQGAFERMLVLLFGSDDPEKVFEALSHQHLKSRSDPEEMKELRQSTRAIRYALSKLGMSPDVIADVFLAVHQDSIEGDDRNGYRIRSRLANQTMTVFVVKEAAEYRVLELISPYGSGHSIAREVLERAEKGHLTEARRLLDWVREEATPSRDDDPLSGHLLPRFWTKAQEGSIAEVRYAAASLLAQEKLAAKEAIPILEEGLRNTSTSEERERFELALSIACSLTQLHQETLAYASALLEKHPSSDRALSIAGAALVALGRFDVLDSLLEKRLKKDPADVVVARLKLSAALKQVDLDLGRKQEEILQKAGKLEAVDLNNLAWLALLAGRLDQHALDTVQQAVIQSRGNDASLLHTVAAIYAETGKSAEAREVLLQSIQLRGHEEPDPDSWYVFGRIAENYDELEAACSMYLKVVKPISELSLAESTYALAQRRLKQIDRRSRR